MQQDPKTETTASYKETAGYVSYLKERSAMHSMLATNLASIFVKPLSMAGLPIRFENRGYQQRTCLLKALQRQ